VNFLSRVVLAGLLLSGLAQADELMLSYGGGPQQSTSQNNRTYGLDYSFFRFERTERQHILIGVSLTQMTTDAPNDKSVFAFSVYPQVNLYLRKRRWGHPFVFARALGPGYINNNRLGARQQAHHFSFLTQVGAGVYLNWNKKSDAVLMLSFKHFSNNNLFRTNKGFDFPFVLNFGIKF